MWGFLLGAVGGLAVGNSDVLEDLCHCPSTSRPRPGRPFDCNFASNLSHAMGEEGEGGRGVDDSR